MQTQNWQVFAKDPRKTKIPNDGVAEVGTPTNDKQREVLRHELQTFVCEGEYQRGLQLILESYLGNLDKATQPAVWISGFYGSGKSHLVRVLEYLWQDLRFPDNATARSLTTLPRDIEDVLHELSIAGRREGGLWAASGNMRDAAGDSVRLAVVGVFFKSAGLPTSYEHGRFVMYLKQNDIYEQVKASVEAAGKRFESELLNLYVSPVIRQAVLTAKPDLAANDTELQQTLRSQYGRVQDISEDEMLGVIREVMVLQSADANKLPCTLLILDELQQYLGDSSDRTLQVQGIVQACSKRFGSKLLFVATGQSALMAHPQLQKLRDRFTLRVELSDTDVEKVLRQVVLRKTADKKPELKAVLDETLGEIDRQLQGSKIGPKGADKEVLEADYPLLPVRRRFWERTLHAVDKAGSAGQLRTQLRIVHEASKSVAEQPLGTVVPGDFIYSQISNDMLNSGVLLRDIEAAIRNMDDGTPEGRLKARLCSLIFLIGQLPTDQAADIGVRPTVGALADLLVIDLKDDGPVLRQRIPELLQALVDDGTLMMLAGNAGNEYRLQTRESAEWEAAYRAALAEVMANDGRIASDRSSELRQAVSNTLKVLPLTQGDSKTPRSIRLEFGSSPPPAEGAIPVWVRDEWSVSEKTVRDDARASGTESPIIYVLIPRRNADNLKRALAGHAAATRTLESKNAHSAATAEWLEAKGGMETRLARYRRDIEAYLTEALAHARVFMGGGNETVGSNLKDAVQKAAADALARFYPQFNLADDSRWDKVFDRARDGNSAPLEVLGHNRESKDHPAVTKVLSSIGSGKSGSELRKIFENAPYGWPRDALNGILLTLLSADLISAKLNGSPVTAKSLDKRELNNAQFRSQTITITTGQRLKVRSLLTDGNIKFEKGEELQAVPQFLATLQSLAQAAGGAAPAPAVPDTEYLERIRHLSGNEQLMALYEERERLQQDIKRWRDDRSRKEERLPRYNTLKSLFEHATSLKISKTLSPQIEAITAQRTLLAEPDPVPPLSQELSAALRDALNERYSRYTRTYAQEMQRLTGSDVWAKMPREEARIILQRNNLKEPTAPKLGTEEDLLGTLRSTSLSDLDNRIAALSARVNQALLEANQYLEPRTIPIMAPQKTLKTTEEVEAYISDLRDEILRHIHDGNPVVIQ